MKLYFSVVLMNLKSIFIPDVKINEIFLKNSLEDRRIIKNIFIYFTSIITLNNKYLT